MRTYHLYIPVSQLPQWMRPKQARRQVPDFVIRCNKICYHIEAEIFIEHSENKQSKS